MKEDVGLREFLDESARVALSLVDSIDQIHGIQQLLKKTQKSGNKILVAGNGGSCSDALHFVGELTCTYKSRDRQPIGAVALNSNQAAVTAWVNDFGFDTFYSRQVEALGKSGDVLFLLSTGGGDRENGFSMNLVNAAETATDLGLKVVSLLGKTGGELIEMSDHFVLVDSYQTAIIQQAHITIVHSICELLE